MSRRDLILFSVGFGAVFFLAGLACAASMVLADPTHQSGWDHAIRVLTLQDYNTRVVVVGAGLLGLAAGVIGTFMLLRKRALMGDALSHATLPGIGLAFIVMTHWGGDGKYLPGLLLGATVSSLIGVACVLLIRNLTRLKEDVALGVVLSVFFGLGVSMLGVIQTMKQGNAAGIESFIYGKTASMLASDAAMIAWAAGGVAVACVLLFKEFGVVCFDQGFAEAQGWPVVVLDVLMLLLVVAVTVIGLQAVGLILIIALLIIPPAAARFWTDRLWGMVVVSGVIGVLSGLFGAGLSALVPRLPAGAIIVTVAAVFFVISFVLGPSRGVVVRWVNHTRLGRRIARQHLLRAMYEQSESAGASDTGSSGSTQSGVVSWQQLLSARSWSQRRLSHQLRTAARQGLIQPTGDRRYCLTDRGLAEAGKVMRNHRLWEIFLITHADIAPSHVDRDADQIEHVLGHQMVEKLEALLQDRYPQLAVPPSPHAIGPGVSGG